MAELEANLLRALNIPVDEQPKQVYGSNRKSSKPSSVSRTGVKNNSRAPREDSPTKSLGKAR